MDLGSMVTETMETMIYPGSGPLDGGKTLRPALVYMNGDVSNTEYRYARREAAGEILEYTSSLR